jgi:hypothetical protein
LLSDEVQPELSQVLGEPLEKEIARRCLLVFFVSEVPLSKIVPQLNFDLLQAGQGTLA